MLEVYFRDDIARSLTAVTVAALKASTASGANVEYLRGFLDAQRANALNYGVWPAVEGGVRQALGDAGFGKLLLV